MKTNLKQSVLVALTALCLSAGVVFSTAWRVDDLEMKRATVKGQTTDTVSGANDGRWYYDTDIQKFQCSTNTGAYVDCMTVVAALSANGSNCTSTQAAIGVDASGNAEGCFTPPGVPGGANTQVQFNNSGGFGGDAGLTYVLATDVLTIGGTGRLELPGGSTAAAPGLHFGPADGTVEGIFNRANGELNFSLQGVETMTHTVSVLAIQNPAAASNNAVLRALNGNLTTGEARLELSTRSEQTVADSWVAFQNNASNVSPGTTVWGFGVDRNSSPNTQQLKVSRGNSGLGTNDVLVFDSTPDSGIVNALLLTPSTTGTAVKLGVQGTDTNVNLDLVPKGTGGVQLNSGTAIRKHLSGTATLDFANVTGPECSADLTITVTGAADGDVCQLGVPNASVAAKSQFTCWANAANTVSVRHCCATGTCDPASGTFRASVTQY